MKLHVVGGFLGSGKTTAIIGAAKQLMTQGQRVGVITNDQGKYLVDTAFFELANVPTVEVSGGCFCCNYSDLDARLDQLKASARPDVIFAESVGSCADIVATVVKPLLQLKVDDVSLRSFSVFVDARLLRLWLLGHPLPFAENVVYIFEKQIEEAGLLVINKIDLLTASQLQETASLAARRLSAKHIYLHNAHRHDLTADWLHLLNGSAGKLVPNRSLEIDYARYGAGEAQLAWLDETLTLHVSPGEGRAVIQQLIGAITQAIQARQWPIGHLKFLVRDADTQAKISFTTTANDNWASQLPALTGSQVSVLVNARVQASAAELRQLVQQTVAQVANGAGYTETDVACFHPGQPQPQHRFA